MFNKKEQKEQDFSKGFVYNTEEQRGKGKLSLVLVVVTVLMIVLVAFTTLQNTTIFAGSQPGTLTGFAVDEMGAPIQVEVSVYDTNIKVVSDAYGFFRINDVPGGDQSVIVAYGRVASEVKVNVKSGDVTDVGAVVVQTSLVEELELN